MKKREQNYMVFENLKQLKRNIDVLLSIDPKIIDSIITNGHDWASEHVTTAKDDIEEVYNFLINKIFE